MTATITHGTTNAYRHHGCRCEPCRDAEKAYQRDRYAARGRPDRPEPAPARLFEPRPPWMQFASCRPEYADRPLDQWVDLFFPTRGQSNAEARAICAECPARQACADHGLAEHHGVWGGTSERERRRLRRKLTAHTSPPA